MQECRECGMVLIVGVSGMLETNGTDSPDIICLNCTARNAPMGVEFEPEGHDDRGDFDDGDVPDPDDPQDFIGYAPGRPGGLWG